MAYYIFIENGKINGAGQAQQIDDTVTNFEVTEQAYNDFIAEPTKYMWDGSAVVLNPNFDAEQLAKAKLHAKELSAINLSLIKDLTFQFTPTVRGKLLIQTPTMSLRDVITNFKTFAETSRGIPANSFRYYDVNGDQQPSPELKNYDADLLYFQMFYIYTLLDKTYAQYEVQYNAAKTIDEVNAITSKINYQAVLDLSVDTILAEATKLMKEGSEYGYIEVGVVADNNLPEGYKTLKVLCQEGESNIVINLPELVRGGRINIDNLRSTPVTLRPYKGEKIAGVDQDLDVDANSFVQIMPDAKNGTWDIQFTLDNSPKQSSGLIFIDNKGSEFTPTKIKGLPGSIDIVKNSDGTATLDVPPHIKSFANEGIFATLNYNEQINTDFHDQRPYYSNTGISGGEFVYMEEATKSFIVQETDLQDPNITGGTPFVLANYVRFQDNPILNTDGYIELKAVDVESKDYITDRYGNPIAIRQEFKAGQRVDELLLLGLYQATGAVKVGFEIDTNIQGNILTMASDSCVCVQALSKNSDTGLAFMAFQLHTGYRIQIENRFYGANYQNLAMALTKDKSEIELSDGTELLGNGLFIDVTTKTKAKIENNKLVLTDNGVDEPVWCIGMLSDKIDSSILQGQVEKLTVKVKPTLSAFKYGIVKWVGTGDPTFHIIEKYENGSPVFAKGWELVDSESIPADATEDQAYSRDFNLPSDMVQYATILYPLISSIPTQISITDFEGDIQENQMEHFIKSTFPIKEEHLRNTSGVYRGITEKLPNEIALRYTVNDTPTKMPFGIVSGESNDIINANNWYTSNAKFPWEGDGEFKANGHITMSYNAQLFNETNTENNVDLWLAKVEANGSFTEVQGSRTTLKIGAKTFVPRLIQSNKFGFDVKSGDKYRMFAQSNIADGFYLQTNSTHIPLLRLDMSYDSVSEFEQDILDRLTELEKKVKP